MASKATLSWASRGEVRGRIFGGAQGFEVAGRGGLHDPTRHRVRWRCQPDWKPRLLCPAHRQLSTAGRAGPRSSQPLHVLPLQQGRGTRAKTTLRCNLRSSRRPYCPSQPRNHSPKPAPKSEAGYAEAGAQRDAPRSRGPPRQSSAPIRTTRFKDVAGGHIDAQ